MLTVVFRFVSLLLMFLSSDYLPKAKWGNLWVPDANLLSQTVCCCVVCSCGKWEGCQTEWPIWYKCVLSELIIRMCKDDWGSLINYTGKKEKQTCHVGHIYTIVLKLMPWTWMEIRMICKTRPFHILHLVSLISLIFVLLHIPVVSIL